MVPPQTGCRADFDMQSPNITIKRAHHTLRVTSRYTTKNNLQYDGNRPQEEHYGKSCPLS